MNSVTRLILILLCVSLPLQVWADKGGPSNQGLKWADNTGSSTDASFHWINIGSGHRLTPVNNDLVYSVPMPFSFNFYGTDYNTLYVSSNGWMSFHDYATNNDFISSNDDLTTMPQNDPPDTLIAATWDDIRYQAPNAGIDTLTIGTFPYRRFLVQYTEINKQQLPYPDSASLTMQVVFYETTNIIKKQYLTPGTLTGGNPIGATVGIRLAESPVSDQLQFLYNQNFLEDELAILYYPSANTNLSANLSLNADADTVVQGTQNQEFTLNVNALDLNQPNTYLDGMGKADVVRITPAFGGAVVPNIRLTEAVVDNEQSFFLLNSPNPPSEAQSTVLGNIATWFYNGTNLIVQFPPFAVKDSVNLTYQLDIPDDREGTVNFLTEIYSRAETGQSYSALVPFVIVTTANTLTLTPLADSVGVVGSQLPNGQDFEITVRDANGNGVANVPVSFVIESIPSGSQNTTLTNYFISTSQTTGTARTQLTFGTKVGTYQVRAYANTTPLSVLFTAYAIADAPDSILIVSNSSVAGQFGQALADSVRFRLVDQYENPISDSTISFIPVSGSVNPVSRTTNAAGEAATSWTLGQTGTPQLLSAQWTDGTNTANSANVTATVTTGAATALELITLRGIAGEDSAAAIAGEEVTFTVRAVDAFGNPVSGTTIDFEALPGYTVNFDSDQLITDSNGRVTNVVSTDVAQDSTFFRAIIAGTDTLDLHVYHLTYVAGSLSPTVTDPGASVGFSVQIENPSPRTVTLNSSGTLFEFSEGATTFSAALASGSTVLPGANTLQFATTTINSNFSISSFTPELTLAGTGTNNRLNGTILLPANSLQLFDVDITLSALTPSTVTEGRPATFTAQLSNTGSGNVTLSPTGSFLSFSDDTVYLDQSFAIPGGGAPVAITFTTNQILSNNDTNDYPSSVTLSGFRNGLPFDTTLTTGLQQILVQRVPNVIVNTISVAPNTVSQGRDSVLVTLTFRNNGTNRATAEIDLANDVTLATSQLNGIRPQETTTLSIPANTNSSPVTFYFNIASNYPTGTDNALTTYRLVDINSDIADTLTTTAAVANEFNVVSRSSLSITNAALSTNLVVPGQTGIVLNIDLQNSGAADARINSGDVDLIFNNNHILTPSTAFPVTVTGGGGLSNLSYTLTVDPNSAIGFDPLDVSISYLDTLSGKSYTLAGTDLDSLEIRSAIPASDLQIQKVTAPAQVVQGQSGLNTFVRLKNLNATTSIQVDSLLLFSGNTGISGSILTALPVTIAAGDTAQFAFSLDIGGAATTGNSFVDARFKATELRFGTTLSDTGAVNPATVTVFRPAALSFSLESIEPDTVSQGQSGIIYSARLQNGVSGDFRAIANIDTVSLNVSSGITATRVSPVELPFSLASGTTQLVQFRLDVPAAVPAGTYSLAASATGADSISGSALSATATNVNLEVQAAATLAATAISIVKNATSRDSAYVGQQDLIVTATVQNNSTAPAMLDNVSLVIKNALNNDLGYPVQLLTNNLPVTLSSGATTDVQFSVDIPGNLLTNDFPVFFGAIVSGEDVNSGASLIDTTLSLKTLQIFTAPDIANTATFLDTTGYGPGETATFHVRVTNNGGTPLVLSGSTQLVLKKITDLNTTFTVPVDLTNSPAFIGANTDTTLQFSPITLNTTGTYQVTANVLGSAFGDAQSFTDISTNTAITVGDSVNINATLALSDNAAIIGDLLTATLSLENNTMVDLETDDGDSTRLELRYADNNELLSIEAFDSVVTIQSGIPSQLNWDFTVPLSARSGVVNVNAIVSLNNGDISIIRQQSFEIQTGVIVSYDTGSLAPDSVVAGQTTQFIARFINTGSTDLLVDRDSSFIEFTDGSLTYSANVAESFVISGNDTSEIFFQSKQIPVGFSTGNFDVSFHLFGDLSNGDTLTALDTTVANEINVISPATIVVDSLSLSPVTMIAGAENIEARYYLRNTGQSAAQIRSITSRFLDAADGDASSFWSLQSQDPVAVDTLLGSDTLLVRRFFRLSNNIPNGQYRGRAEIRYNDIRRPNTVVTFNNPTPEDTVDVLERATLVFSGAITSPAGAIDETVSTLQSFNWQLDLSLKPGSGPLQVGDSTTIFLDFRNKGFYLDAGLTRDTLTIRMFPDETRDIPIWAGNTARVSVLSAVITDTSLSSDGVTPALIDGPNAATLEMEIQRRAELAARWVDGPMVVGTQQFTLKGVIENNGTAGVLPNTAQALLTYPNAVYSLDSGLEDQTVTIGDTIEYLFTALAATSDTSDFVLSIGPATAALDTNSNAAAFIADTSDVKTIELSTDDVTVVAVIDSSEGAKDGVVSTGQTFIIAASYQYTNVVDTGKTAIISLPPGYSTPNETVSIGTNNGVVYWAVRAPNTVSPQQNINIEFSGYRDTGGTPALVSATVPIAIETVTQARLTLQASIVEPSGAIDGVVSTDQGFGLRVLVSKTGTALTSGSNTLNLSLPANYLFSGDTTFTLQTGVADTLQITAPNIASVLDTISVTLQTAANDTNTNVPATVLNDQRDIAVRTVAKADLALAITAPDSFSTSTSGMQVQLQVSNLGTAGVSADSIPVLVEIDPNVFHFSDDGTDASRTFNVGLSGGSGTRTISLISQSQTGSSEIRGTLQLTGITDVNNNPAGATVFSSVLQDTATVSVVNSGTVQISSFAIITPSGAVDSTISTGQQFTLQAQVLFAGNLVSGTRKVTLALPDNSGFTTNSPLEITAGQNGVTTASWLIVAPSDTLLKELISDTRRGESAEQALKRAFDFTLTATATDGSSGLPLPDTQLLTVQLFERAKLSIAASIVSPAGAIDGVISTDQAFGLRVAVTNSGTAGTTGLDTVLVSLPTGYLPSDTTIYLATGSADTLQLTAPSTASALSSITAELTGAALDENSNNAATIVTGLREIAIQTVAKADLALAITAPDSFSTSTSGMQVQLQVSNLGTAGVSADSIPVLVEIDPNVFHFSDDGTDASRTFNVGLSGGSGTRTISLISQSQTGSSEIRGTLQLTGITDVNNNPAGATVFSSVLQDTATVSVVNSGTVQISSFAIITPSGAVDSTISTGQQFTLQAQVLFAGNLVSGTRKVTLALPDNSGFTTNSPLEITAGQNGVTTASWLIVAPSDTLLKELISDTRRGESAEQALKRAFDFTLTATATDGSSGLPLPDTQLLTVQLFERAKLSIAASIVSPAGAIDRTLSTRQFFDVNISISNSGLAGTSDSSEVTLVIPTGYQLISGNNPLILATGDTQQIRLRAPQTAHTDARNLGIQLTTPALDENTGAAAQVLVSDATIAGLRTERRADLSLNISSIGSYSTGRTGLPITVEVRNSGQAGITPNLVPVRIEIDDLNVIQFTGNPSAIADTINISINEATGLGTGTVLINTLNNIASTNLTGTLLSDSLQDENNNYNDTTVVVSIPGAVEQISVIESGGVNVTRLEITQPVGATDSTVSTRQIFTVEAGYGFDTVLDTGRTAAIQLPAGYSAPNDTQTVSGDNGTVSWQVTAPATASVDVDSIRVVLNALRDIGGGSTDPVSTNRSIPVTTVDRVNLVLETSIDSPEGATDGEFSTGQTFDFKMKITNSGTANTEPGDLNQLSIQLPAGYTTPVSIFTFATGDSVTLTITAPATASPLASITAQIDSAANDENTGEPAFVSVGTRQTAVRTVAKADLRVSVSTLQSFSTDTDSLPVTLSVGNFGTAGVNAEFVPVKVTIDPNLVQFENSASDTMTFLVKLDSTRQIYLNSQSVPDTAAIRGDLVLNAIQDENTNQRVFSSDSSATDSVEIVSGGSVNISSFEITNPAGATDSTISTSQEFDLKVTVDFLGNLQGNSQNIQLFLPQNGGFTTNSPLRITNISGSVDTTWTIRAPVNIQLPATFDFVVRAVARDGSSGLDRIENDTLTVIVQTAPSLAVRGNIISPAGAIDRTLSTGQIFDLRVGVENQVTGGAGTTDANTVEVQLPTGFTIGDSSGTTVIQLATGTFDTLKVTASPIATTTLDSIKINLTSAALDSNSNAAAAIGVGERILENLRVVEKANLAVSLSTESQFSAGRDSLLVTIQVQNSGTARITPITVPVTVEIDTAYFRFSDGSTDTTQSINVVLTNGVGIGSSSFYINSLTNLGTTPIRAVIDTAAIKDENTNATAFASVPESSADVEIVESAMVTVGNLQISAPVAGRDTVSSGQQFSVTTNLTFSGNVAPTGRTATISLPDGFVALSDTQRTISPDSTSVTWKIIAPNANLLSSEGVQNGTRGNSPQSILADSLNISVSAEGIDISGGATPPAADTIGFWLVNRAQLSVFSEIIEPSGAIDGTISTEQWFDVRVWVENSGEATTTGNNQVTVKIPASFQIEGSAVGDSADISIGTGEAESDTVRIFAGATVPGGQPQISAILQAAATDANRNKPADILQKTSAFNVGVVQKALLQADSLIASADIVAPEQPFTLRGFVTNTGTAKLLPNDSVYVTLEYDDAQFTISNGTAERRRKLINNRAEFIWQLQANTGITPNNYNFTARIVADTAKDENTNDYAAIAADTTASFNMQVVETGGATISAAYINAPGTTEITASGLQRVRIFLQPQLVGDFSTARAKLSLPQNYFAVDSLTANILDNGLVEWQLDLPDTTSGGQTLNFALDIRAVSAINNAISEDSDTLKITLQKRANLSITGNVVETLFNDVVSQGDTITYRAVVSNLGEAGVLATPTGEVTLSLGEKLFLLDGETPTKPFGIDQPVEWQVRAEENSAIAGLLNQINETRAEKSRLLMLQSANQVDESGGSDARQRELNQQLDGLVQQLTALADPSHLTARITRSARDANTGSTAFVSVDSVRRDVQIAEPVSASILSLQLLNDITSQPLSTVSTGQVFTVSALTDFVGAVIEKRGTLELPEGYTILDGDSTKSVNADNTIRWKVSSPTIISGGLPQQIKLVISGRDQNGDPGITDPVQLNNDSTGITVEPKTNLQFYTPDPAFSLTASEQFTIRAVIKNDNFGGADATGGGTVQLTNISSAFTIDAGTPATQNFTIDAGVDSAIVSWNITAPAGNVSTTATLRLTQIPLDENTQTTASVNTTTETVDINMVPTQLELRIIDEVTLNEGSYTAGQQNLAVFGLAFRNPNPAEIIRVDSIHIRVTENESNVPDIQNLLSRMEMVSWGFYQTSPNGNATPPDQLISVAISDPGSNPVQLIFDQPLQIPAGESDSLVLRIDLSGAQLNRNFNLSISNVWARGASSNPADVLDGFGTPIINSGSIKSGGITILSGDPEVAFRNYPNPFGKDSNNGSGLTFFSFVMESGSEATISIYTLTGQLVYRQTESGLDSGGRLYNRTLFWNGKNDVGQTVVNGVYIAILEANGRQYTTKVAFVK